MAHFLIVDDDPIFTRQLEMYLDKLGHSSEAASSLAEGLQRCAKGDYSVVLLDVNLPDSSGLEGIEAFKLSHSGPEVIIITGNNDPDGAELAIRNGAWYYLEKPLDYNTLRLVVGRVLQFRENSRQARQRTILNREAIVGADPKLNECLNQLALAARSNGSVLITGETGVGKELFARAVHDNSSRAEHNFVVVDCTNVPETLAESILFGHEKGAFTDARGKREGLIGLADGGTLFLDEIGDLDFSLQRPLLRVIQEKSYRPLGAATESRSDCRFVAATNRNIETMAEHGEFRNDLYYRLATFHLHIPALRERISDVRLLTRHFVDAICLENAMNPKGVSMDFLDALEMYHWPGNVRELNNVIHSAIANADVEPILYPHHLPLDLKAVFFRRTRGASADEADIQPLSGHDAASETLSKPDDAALPTLKEYRDNAYALLEADYLDRLLAVSGKNVKKACAIADISRSRLYQLLDKHDKGMK